VDSKKIIDRGEADAIDLALQMKCDWFLTDGAGARQFAESLGLEVHGSIGLLLLAVAVGHIKAAPDPSTVYRIGHSSIWVSERVIREAEKAIDELLQE